MIEQTRIPSNKLSQHNSEQQTWKCVSLRKLKVSIWIKKYFKESQIIFKIINLVNMKIIVTIILNYFQIIYKIILGSFLLRVGILFFFQIENIFEGAWKYF